MKNLVVKKSLAKVLFLNFEFNYFSLSLSKYSRILFLCLIGLFVNERNCLAAVSEYHSMFIKTDGSLWASGRNHYGQLGDGTTTQRNTSTQIISTGVSQGSVGFNHSLVLKTDGSLWAFGSNSNGQLGDGTTTQRNTPTQIISTGVSQVSAGFYHSLVLKTDGSLWAFGKNQDGNLGDGTTTNRNTPTQIISSGVAKFTGAWPFLACFENRRESVDFWQ